MLKRSIFILCLFCVLACQKKKPETVELTYEVSIPQDNKVVINYQSDYADATGGRKDIVYNSDSTNQFQGSLWYSKRYVKDDQSYYIKVTYTKLEPAADSSYKVVIYKGEDVLVEDKGRNIIELSGSLK